MPELIVWTLGCVLSLLGWFFYQDPKRLQQLALEISHSISLSLLFALTPLVLGIFLTHYAFSLQPINTLNILLAIVGIAMIVGGLFRLLMMPSWHQLLKKQSKQIIPAMLWVLLMAVGLMLMIYSLFQLSMKH